VAESSAFGWNGQRSAGSGLSAWYNRLSFTQQGLVGASFWIAVALSPFGLLALLIH
jgi:hypothetical protein